MPAAPAIGAVETGRASWYGHPYHGRRAANGEVYDIEQLTAAHRTLAFNTWVRVHNLENGKHVDVRITDRGPFVKERIIDLSRAAARAIDSIGPGVVDVRVEVVAVPAAAAAASLYAVQAGAFRNRGNAERLRDDMVRRFGKARLVPREGVEPVWRVLVGECPSAQEAEELAARIRAGNADSFVVRLDQPASP